MPNNPNLNFYLRLLLLLLAVCGFNKTLAAQDKALAWEVEGNAGHKVYLMGSIHFAAPSFYPLRQEIMEAFESADNLVVEINMTPQNTMEAQRLAFSMGLYQPPDSLKDHISPETYKLLVEYLENSGLPIEPFLVQKPGMILMSIAALELAKLGLSPTHGIDLHFTNRAQDRKPILELESIAQQLELMLEIDDPDVVLRQSLQEFGEYEQMMETMIAAWKSGDVAAMEKLLIDEPLREFPDSREYFDRIFTLRNKQMTEKIKAYLDSDQSYFVVVGAGHLIGDEGIVRLLQKAGYQVKRL